MARPVADQKLSDEFEYTCTPGSTIHTERVATHDGCECLVGPPTLRIFYLLLQYTVTEYFYYVQL